MQDLEFGMNKEALAEELKEGILPERKPIPRKTKIRQFLLSQNIIPILKERLSIYIAQ